MIETIRVSPATPTVPLPDNWNYLLTEVLNAYNRYFVRINKSRAGDKQTEALTIIKQLYETTNISKESKNFFR